MAPVVYHIQQVQSNLDFVTPQRRRRNVRRTRSNLERELGFALRLPPNDERQQETHGEDQAEGCDAPHCSASLHGQNTERQDEGP